jgi:hypothetical protein
MWERRRVSVVKEGSGRIRGGRQTPPCEGHAQLPFLARPVPHASPRSPRSPLLDCACTPITIFHNPSGVECAARLMDLRRAPVRVCVAAPSQLGLPSLPHLSTAHRPCETYSCLHPFHRVTRRTLRSASLQGAMTRCLVQDQACVGLQPPIRRCGSLVKMGVNVRIKTFGCLEAENSHNTHYENVNQTPSFLLAYRFHYFI